jgi:ABC-2 type transport system permease protein
MPGGWLSLDAAMEGSAHLTHAELLRRSWQAATTPQLWGGVVMGCAMLYAAMRLRRWRELG